VALIFNIKAPKKLGQKYAKKGLKIAKNYAF
jgi:hypothetical protein